MIYIKDAEQQPLPSGDFPQHQAKGIHVSHLERLKARHVDGLVQDLWCHVPPCAHLGVLPKVQLIVFTAKRK